MNISSNYEYHTGIVQIANFSIFPDQEKGTFSEIPLTLWFQIFSFLCDLRFLKSICQKTTCQIYRGSKNMVSDWPESAWKLSCISFSLLTITLANYSVIFFRTIYTKSHEWQLICSFSPGLSHFIHLGRDAPCVGGSMYICVLEINV